MTSLARTLLQIALLALCLGYLLLRVGAGQGGAWLWLIAVALLIATPAALLLRWLFTQRR